MGWPFLTRDSLQESTSEPADIKRSGAVQTLERSRTSLHNGRRTHYSAHTSVRLSTACTRSAYSDIITRSDSEHDLAHDYCVAMGASQFLPNLAAAELGCAFGALHKGLIEANARSSGAAGKKV
jgi:hypothetical protein